MATHARSTSRRQHEVSHPSLTDGDRAQLVAALKADYQRRIEALAEELAPRFRAGELRGFDDDPEPLNRLEKVCTERFGGSDFETFLTLACSSYTAITFDEGWTHPRFHAGAAASHDVLRVALARGWYRPAKEEVPSALELKDGADRAITVELDRRAV